MSEYAPLMSEVGNILSVPYNYLKNNSLPQISYS